MTGYRTDYRLSASTIDSYDSTFQSIDADLIKKLARLTEPQRMSYLKESGIIESLRRGAPLLDKPE